MRIRSCASVLAGNKKRFHLPIYQHTTPPDLDALCGRVTEDFSTNITGKDRGPQFIHVHDARQIIVKSNLFLAFLNSTLSLKLKNLELALIETTKLRGG